MVTIDVRHDGLGRFQRITAPSRSLAEKRGEALKKRWEAEYARREAVLRRAGSDPAALKKLEADERTAEAERAVAALTTILFTAVRSSPIENWSPLYDTTSFQDTPPVEPVAPKMEAEPRPSDFKRAPLTLMTLLNPAAMRRRREAAVAKYQTAYEGWSYLKRWREQEHEKAVAAFRAQHTDWSSRQDAFLDLQRRANARLNGLLDGYARGEREAVIGHCDLTLLSLERPEGFPAHWEMRFAEGVLEIDYDLPSMAQIPSLRAVKYAASRDVFETVPLSERERERLYGEAVFQTSLAVLHTLFTCDTVGVIRAVSFKGWANYIDSAGVRPGRACIVAVTADKREFAKLDLTSVDPQACFRALNGTMSAKLAAMATRQAA